MSDDRTPGRPAPEPTASLRVEQGLLFAIAVLALAIRLYRIDWGLPMVFEEATPLKKAWDMWGFGPMRVFDPNPHWFQYPSLLFYVHLAGEAVTALGLRLTGVARSADELNLLYLSDPTAFYCVGRGITALFGAAIVLPTWALARRAGGVGAAAVATLLVAIHPGLIAKSQVVEVDVPLVFLTMLGLARAVAHHPGSSRREWFVSGLVAGLAASAKYPGLILLVPFAFVAWGAPRLAAPRAARPPGASPARRDRKVRTRTRPAAAGSPSRLVPWITRMAIFGAGLVLALFATSPYLFLSRAEAARDLAIGRQLMTLGHFGVSAGAAYATYAHSWFTSFLGAPLGILSIAGLAWFAARRERWALVLLSLAVPFLLVVGSWEMKADRYLLPLVPIAAIGAGVLLARLGQAASARARAAGWLLPALGGLACALPLALMLPPYWRTLGTDTRDESRVWIESHLPPGSQIASELYGPDLLSPIRLLTAEGDVLAQIAARTPSRPLFAVQTVPMFVMAPERSTKFYDLSLYAQADAFVVTSSIRERYRGDSTRYAAQLAFYDSLEAQWPRVASFVPREGGPGPRIAVHRNPAATVHFAARGGDPPADSAVATTDPLTGVEAYWYLEQGLSMELGGHDRAAEESYRLALRFGRSEPANYTRAAIRLAGLLDVQGRHADALRALQVSAERGSGQGVARALYAARETLRVGRPICVRVRP